jgi:ABC-type transport system involved in multi-copper enzyme maturation permease subunit
MMFSSLVKKSGTSAILTFFFLFLITNIIYGTLSGFEIEAWYMIDYVSSHISDATVNGMNVIEPGFIYFMGIQIFDQGYDPLKAAWVAATWGIVTLAISFLVMRRREI